MGRTADFAVHTGSHPHQIGVVLVYRDIADRASRLIVEERCPRSAVILSLPEAARSSSEIKELRL